MSWQIHIYQISSQYLKRRQRKVRKTEVWQTDRQTDKLELDLYYVMTNSYTKFQVNISKDGREKSGKRTDRQTDSEQTKSPPGKPVGD